MNKRTETQLRKIMALVERGASFDEFPDWVTWADLAEAEALKAREENTNAG